MLQRLGDEERMEGRLVVPDIRVKFVAFEAERGFGQFKTFVTTELNRRVERQEQHEADKCEEQGSQRDEAEHPAALRFVGGVLTAARFARIGFRLGRHDCGIQ